MLGSTSLVAASLRKSGVGACADVGKPGLGGSLSDRRPGSLGLLFRAFRLYKDEVNIDGLTVERHSPEVQSMFFPEAQFPEHALLVNASGRL